MKQIEIGGCVLILILLTIPFITSAQQIVEVTQPQEDSGNIFTRPFSIFKSQIFWGGVIIFVFILALLIGLFFLVRWVVKFLKSRSDAFWRLRSERLKLAKIHRRYPSTSWYKVHKNTPIRLVRKEEGKLIITKPIGFHRGDYITHEGNVVISLNLDGNKKWLLFPITDILIIPNQESIELAQRNDKGKREMVTIANLPKPSDIIRFNENEILIFAESLSSVGMFLIPVVKDENGGILDLSMPVFESLKKVVLGEYLYEQTDEFTKIAKKSMDINPNLRYAMKTQDTSQSVELPPSQK